MAQAPLTEDERGRAEAGFVPYVAGQLAAQGRFRISVDRAEMVEVFQGVARRVGAQLGRPVVSVSNGREVTISFRDGDSEAGEYGLHGPGARPLPE